MPIFLGTFMIELTVLNTSIFRCKFYHKIKESNNMGITKRALQRKSFIPWTPEGEGHWLLCLVKIVWVSHYTLICANQTCSQPCLVILAISGRCGISRSPVDTSSWIPSRIRTLYNIKYGNCMFNQFFIDVQISFLEPTIFAENSKSDFEQRWNKDRQFSGWGCAVELQLRENFVDE